MKTLVLVVIAALASATLGRESKERARTQAIWVVRAGFEPGAKAL